MSRFRQKVCTIKRTKASQPEESDAIAKKSKNGQMRFQGIVKKTKMALVVWKTRWKTNEARCSLWPPFLPAFPKMVVEKASPRPPCTRSARLILVHNCTIFLLHLDVRKIDDIVK